MKMIKNMLGKKHSKETKLKISQANSGPRSSQWNGGRKVVPSGHILIKDRNHPNANSSGYVSEHVKVATKAMGRPMKKGEVVHHINCNPQDNRNRNLLVCDRSYHSSLHHKMSRLYAIEHFGGFKPAGRLING